MSRLTMGSLFDGIGGFPLAAVRKGITTVWASEIEAVPPHDPCGRHHKAEWCKTAARGHHLRRQPVPGLCRENSYSEVIAANPVVQGVTSKNFGIT